jgi:hypothetical protein
MLALRVPDEDYSRNSSSVLNLISTFLLQLGGTIVLIHVSLNSSINQSINQSENDISLRIFQHYVSYTRVISDTTLSYGHKNKWLRFR